MSGDLPMHVFPTETNASQVAFFSNMISVPKARNILYFTQQSLSTFTIKWNWHSWSSWSLFPFQLELFLFLFFWSLDIMLAVFQTDGAYCTIFFPGTRTLCSVRAVSSTQGNFVPERTLGNVWRHFWWSQLESGGCYWHVMGRGQRY